MTGGSLFVSWGVLWLIHRWFLPYPKFRDHLPFPCSSLRSEAACYGVQVPAAEQDAPLLSESIREPHFKAERKTVKNILQGLNARTARWEKPLGKEIWFSGYFHSLGTRFGRRQKITGSHKPPYKNNREEWTSDLMQEALHIITAENMTARYTLSLCVIQSSFLFLIIQETKKPYWQAITFKLKLNE